MIKDQIDGKVYTLRFAKTGKAVKLGDSVHNKNTRTWRILAVLPAKTRKAVFVSLETREKRTMYIHNIDAQWERD